MSVLFQYNCQQWLNIEMIESIDDYGSDIGVVMRSGRGIRIHHSMRAEFFAAISSLTHPTTGK